MQEPATPPWRLSEVGAPPFLHHIGYVLAAIPELAEGFARSLGATWNGQIIHDTLQMVHVTFLAPPVSGQPLVELVAPAGKESPVTSFLERGGGLHHLCYEVDNLEEQFEAVRASGDVIVRPPLPAVAFGNRRIAWVSTRQRLLIEYLERSFAPS